MAKSGLPETVLDKKQQATAQARTQAKRARATNAGSSSSPQTMWNMADTVMCICSNAYANSVNTGFWDMWFTMSGSVVLTPCIMSEHYTPAEVAQADFCQTRKIDASTHVLFLVNREGKIEPFMIPWIHHALGCNKQVFTDIALGPNTKPVKLRGNAVLKELLIYPLGMDDLAFYLNMQTLDPEDKDENGDEEELDPIPQGIAPKPKSEEHVTHPGNGKA